MNGNFFAEFNQSIEKVLVVVWRLRIFLERNEITATDFNTMAAISAIVIHFGRIAKACEVFVEDLLNENIELVTLSPNDLVARPRRQS